MDNEPNEPDELEGALDSLTAQQARFNLYIAQEISAPGLARLAIAFYETLKYESTNLKHEDCIELTKAFLYAAGEKGR